jgi:hypothetical protein
VFLGSTNSVKPGSVWGTKRGPTLIGDAKAYFETAAAADSALEPATASADCSTTAAPTWDVSLGVPISISGIGSVEVQTALSHAQSITVKIAKTWLDQVSTGSWENAAAKLTTSNAFFRDAVDGHSYMLTSATAIDGLTVTYQLKSSLSVAAQASLQATPTVQVGSAQSPATVKVDVGNSGTTVTMAATGTAWVLGKLVKIDKISDKQVSQAQKNNIALTPHINASVLAPVTLTFKQPSAQ